MRARQQELPKSIGRYEVVRLLGVGAMGRVMLALDPVLGRQVAIKILRSELAIPEDVREGLVVRMRHEAQAAARVTHPNLVILHDMGEDEELGLYLVFEFLEGPTLREKIAKGPLTPRESARLARELGGALAFAHARGVLHRDVKPDNIMLTATGAKIADFGIARVPDSTLTHAGGLLGTPAYSAPETFQKSVFSPASDQFSLATTMYEAISGERAFPGDDAVLVAARIASGRPEPFAERLGLRAELDRVLARATAANPADRFESCDAFGAALAKSLSPAPSAASSRGDGDLRTSEPPLPSDPASAQPVATPIAKERERRPWQVLLGGVVVVVVVALLVRALIKNRDAALAQPPGSAPTSSQSAPSALPSASATTGRPPDGRDAHPPSHRPPSPATSPPTSSAAPTDATAEPTSESSAAPAVAPAPSAAPEPSATP